MRVLLQRVSQAHVSVDGDIIGDIDRGLLLYVGFARSDSRPVLSTMANKVINLRVFPDEEGRFDHSLLDTGGGALLIPQFTLYADTKRGRRPDFSHAMPPEPASDLFSLFVREMSTVGVGRVEAGRFGADMQVDSVNDGPVTIMVAIE